MPSRNTFGLYHVLFSLPMGVRSDFVSPGDRTAVKSGEKIGQLSLFDLAFAGMNHYETAYTHVPHR